MSRVTLRVTLCALLGAPAALAAQPAAGGAAPPGARASATVEPPVIDGRLADEVWSASEPLAGFTQREPSDGSPVSQSTQVRVLYDDVALYIGAWLLDDDPAGIVFGQTLRDASLNDADAFVVVLDTYLDRQNGFVFGTTPAGIEYDGQVIGEGVGGGPGGGRQQRGSGGGFNLNWDGSWDVATTRGRAGLVRRDADSLLDAPLRGRGAADLGLNFERRIRRNSEQSMWAPIPRQFGVYRVSLAGTLELEAPANRTVTVSPYVLGDAFKDYQVLAPGVDFGGKVGGDAKIGINQSLTLDLTVNTDFAQAEVDDQQVNLTRFSLFFPEKRAFFLENAGAFAVGAPRSAELFFSRRIGLSGGREVPIQAGARLTGKVGAFQIGVLNIQTGEAFDVDADTGVRDQVAPNNNFGVLRAYREFGNRSQLGAIFVSRVNTTDTQDHNLTWGVDGRLGIGEALTLDGWAGLTTTPVAADEQATGSGFNDGEYGFAGGMRYVTRDWQVFSGYRQIGEAFNPEVGFVNRLGYRQVNWRFLRHVRTESVPWFREFRPHISGNAFWTLGGFNESYLLHIDNHFAFENGAFFQLPGFNFTGEGLEEPFAIRDDIVIPAGTYHNTEWEFRANTNRGAALSASAGWTLGGFYSGTRFGPNLTVSYRHGDALFASVRADYYDVRLAEGEFRTAVVRLNASYAFTPRVYVQTNVQYNGDTRDLGTNIRIGWLDTAGTGLFLVWNDTNHTGSLERTGIIGGPKQRQLVVKYSRLFNRRG